jgi:hypothetical protein
MKNLIKKIVAKVSILKATLRELLVKLLTATSIRKSKGTPVTTIVVSTASRKEPTAKNSVSEPEIKSFNDSSISDLLLQLRADAAERGRMFDPMQQNEKTGKKRKSKTLRKRNNNRKFA